MTLTIVTVGAKPKANITSLIDDYIKRMPKHIRVVWVFLKHGSGDPSSSMKQEAESILSAIPKKNKIILLDEKGEQFTSPQLSKKLFNTPVDTTIIIGGAYGVSDHIKSHVDLIWSLGKLVYPHQIVRLVISEQMYRAHCINIGHPYHHS